MDFESINLCPKQPGATYHQIISSLLMLFPGPVRHQNLLESLVCIDYGLLVACTSSLITWALRGAASGCCNATPPTLVTLYCPQLQHTISFLFLTFNYSDSAVAVLLLFMSTFGLFPPPPPRAPRSMHAQKSLFTVASTALGDHTATFHMCVYDRESSGLGRMA